MATIEEEDSIDWEAEIEKVVKEKDSVMKTRDEVKEEMKKCVARLRRRDSEIHRLERAEQVTRNRIRRLEQDLLKQHNELKKERERCFRVKKVNIELAEEVKCLKEKERAEANRKRKIREEQEEEEKLVRATKLRVQVEEEERYRIRQEQQ